MSAVSLLSLLTGVFALAAGGTALTRQYALRSQLLDHPNERSSHVSPTPRGGGLGLVLSFLGALTCLKALGLLPGTVYLAFVVGGALIAGVGWLDDHRHVPAWVRMAVHLVSAGLALWSLGGMPPLDMGGSARWDWGWFGQLVGLAGMVWLVNLYNFMDGIDGIAGAEAVTVAGIGGFLVFASGAAKLAWLHWLLGASAAGFLVWNWPSAKIFMGDVGSGFLGFVFGVLAVVSAKTGGLSIWVSTILLGAFLTDATVTLLHRVARGARWYEAHRSHAYQHAARRWNSHLKVTLGVCAINVFWLAPWAWLAWSSPKWAPLATLAALMPLAILAVRLGAGMEDSHEVLG